MHAGPRLLSPLSSEEERRSRERLLALLAERSYREGPEFTLSSGEKSTFYVDGKLTTHHPEGGYLAARLLLGALRGTDCAAIGGPVLGAVPMVAVMAAVSHLEGRPLQAFSVRQEAKGHGTGRAIEGADLARGTRVAMVEDVVTSGGSLLKAMDRVEEEGLVVVKVLALVDRQSGGAEAIGRRCPFEAVFTADELRAVAGGS